jgi:hypothetical protein
MDLFLVHGSSRLLEYVPPRRKTSRFNAKKAPAE